MIFKDIWSRVINIIFHSEEEWNKIVDEDPKRKNLIKYYALPLIIATSLASLIGNALFSYYFSVSVLYMIVSAIIVFIVSLSGVYISAYIVNELAPNFDSEKNINRSFQLVVYSFTAYFLASIIAFLIPPLRFLSIFGLFGIVLFWNGTTPLLHTPKEKKAGFVVVASLVILGMIALLYMVFGGLLSTFFIGRGFLNIL